MGHIAKSDGKVTHDEVAATESVMSQMQLDPGQRKAAIRLFNQGKQPDFPLHEVLAQFLQECHGRRSLVQMFLEIQIATAMADGRLHAAERNLLYQIGSRLGFGRSSIEQLLHLAGRAGTAPDAECRWPRHTQCSVWTASRRRRGEKGIPSPDEPASSDKLVAKGLPEEMIRIAQKRPSKSRQPMNRSSLRVT
jgi:DnaJ like chaperone protein